MEMHQSTHSLSTGSVSQRSSLGLPALIEKLLNSRGYDSTKKVESLLTASLMDMRDPMSLSGMDLALNRFEKALLNNEKICVYGDFDLDGSSGLVLAVDALQRMGFEDVIHYQPKRLSEGYGLHAHAVEAFKEQGVSLIFTVDVGITAIEAVDRANELGIDVILSDHHLPKETLPKACAIINPNSGQCGSELGHLCGAGVAFYTMIALRKHLKEKSLLKVDFNPKELLDLFVIGTMTDMVPLVDENRTLCKHGLIQFKNTQRPGLRKLIDKLGYSGKEISGQDLAIGIAPKLNALSRLEMGLMPIDVLMAKDERYAEQIIDQVLDLNNRRKKLQQEAEAHAEEEYLKSKDPNYCFLWSENYHQGVLGLVATRMSQNFGLVSFIASCNDEGKLVGSARVPESSNLSLPEVLEYCSEYLHGFGGHAQAAGFHLNKDQLPGFTEKLEEYFASENFSSEEKELPEPSFDCEAKISDLNADVLGWLSKIGPYGQDFPVPVFKLNSLQVLKKSVLRGGHIKFRLSQPSELGAGIDALYFSPPKSVNKIQEGDFIDVFAEIQWNYFAGRKSIQMLIRSAKFI